MTIPTAPYTIALSGARISAIAENDGSTVAVSITGGAIAYTAAAEMCQVVGAKYNPSATTYPRIAAAAANFSRNFAVVRHLAYSDITEEDLPTPEQSCKGFCCFPGGDGKADPSTPFPAKCRPGLDSG